MTFSTRRSASTSTPRAAPAGVESRRPAVAKLLGYRENDILLVHEDGTLSMTFACAADAANSDAVVDLSGHEALPQTLYDRIRPANFFEVRVHDARRQPVRSGLLGLCANYEAGRWRADDFASCCSTTSRNSRCLPRDLPLRADDQQDLIQGRRQRNGARL